MRNKNHVDQFTIVGFEKKNSSNIGIGCSFLFFSVKAVRFFLCTIDCGSIITSIFLHKFKNYNRMIGKPDENLGRKATGPVKWQPVA